MAQAADAASSASARCSRRRRSKGRCSGRRRAAARNWGGAAFDPETGYLFVRAANRIGLNRVAKNDGSDPLVDGGLFERVRARRRRGQLAGRPAAHLAAVCGARPRSI